MKIEHFCRFEEDVGVRVAVDSLAGLGKVFDDKYTQVYLEVTPWLYRPYPRPPGCLPPLPQQAPGQTCLTTLCGQGCSQEPTVAGCHDTRYGQNNQNF